MDFPLAPGWCIGSSVARGTIYCSGEPLLILLVLVLVLLALLLLLPLLPLLLLPLLLLLLLVHISGATYGFKPIAPLIIVSVHVFHQIFFVITILMLVWKARISIIVLTKYLGGNCQSIFILIMIPCFSRQ